jgi:predicted ferric reductase
MARLATGALILVLLAPTLLAVWFYPVTLTGPAELLQAAGRLSGILGLTALLLAAAVSVRIPGFDRWFGGLTRLWKRHHYLGLASFLLLMAHPLLLAFAALSVSPQAAVAVLFPPFSPPWTWVGWAALLAMMVFLAPSFAFFGPPDYQRWKGLHLLSGAAVLLGLVHAVPLGRALPAEWDWAVWGVLGLLAVGAFGYRKVLSRGLARRRYTVSAVSPLAEGVVELSLQPEDAPLAYRAGQFVYMAHREPAIAAGFDEEHPFTLSSAPQEAQLRIAIKALGDASGAMQSLAPGAPVWLEGPYGDFLSPKHEQSTQLWLGGGIGITPFIGKARALALQQPPPAVDIHLFYCAHDMKRAYYLLELQRVAAEVAGFRVHAHLFAEHGPLSREFLQAHCPDWQEREVFLCGPPGMIAHMTKLLRNAGVRRLHTEDFELL